MCAYLWSGPASDLGSSTQISPELEAETTADPSLVKQHEVPRPLHGSGRTLRDGGTPFRRKHRSPKEHRSYSWAGMVLTWRSVSPAPSTAQRRTRPSLPLVVISEAWAVPAGPCRALKRNPGSHLQPAAVDTPRVCYAGTGAPGQGQGQRRGRGGAGAEDGGSPVPAMLLLARHLTRPAALGWALHHQCLCLQVPEVQPVHAGSHQPLRAARNKLAAVHLHSAPVIEHPQLRRLVSGSSRLASSG